MSCSGGKQTRTVTECLQTDSGPGHSCVCLYVWIQYLQHGELHENIYICFAFVKGVWEMETTENAVSWAGHKFMSKSVKDDPTCYRKFTWRGLHPSNQEPSEPHITLLFTYSAHDWKSYQTLQKSIATPHTVISTFRFLCVQFIPLKSSQLK